MLYQDVHRNAKQPFIEGITYHDERADASELKEAEYVYVLQPKADHQGSKIPLTEVRRISPYTIEKVLPNNKYLVRKSGTYKTQVLHRMVVRQFTAKLPLPVVRIRPKK